MSFNNMMYFWSIQGLERHLLGTHGLVTASMQDLANKGQDSGRCPVCGKVYQWKLLNHVAKDHMKVIINIKKKWVLRARKYFYPVLANTIYFTILP